MDRMDRTRIAEGKSRSETAGRRVGVFNAETDELSFLLVQKSLELVQTEPGKARHEVTVFSTHRTLFRHVLQRLAWTACFAAESRRVSTIILVQPPPTDYIVRGRSVREGDFFCYTPGGEHISRNHQPGEFLHCSFDEAAFRASYELRVRQEFPSRTCRFTAAPEILEALRALVRRGVQSLQTCPELAEDHVWQSNFERSIFSEHVRLLCSAPVALPACDAISINNRERLLKTAREYLQSHMTKPVYVTELCQAVDVSERALQQAFESLLGVSPMRYLKLRRLQMVRRVLRNSLTKATSVKRVALNHGFWDLGRFAEEYRALFGERPSATLHSLGIRSTAHPAKTGI